MLINKTDINASQSDSCIQAKDVHRRIRTSSLTFGLV